MDGSTGSACQASRHHQPALVHQRSSPPSPPGRSALASVPNWRIRTMIITIAASALAIQLNIMPVRAAQPLVQPVQYGVPVRRPPCGHGWDVSARDGPLLPERLFAAAGSGRQTVPASTLLSRRPIPCSLRPRHRRRYSGRAMLPERNGTAAVSAGTSALLRRRRVLRTSSATPILLSRLNSTSRPG